MLRRDVTLQTRRERQNFDLFAALVASPAALGSTFALPAAGTLAVSTTSVLAATDELVTVNGANYGAPAGAAGAQKVIGFFGPNATIGKAAGAPGTVRVYVRDPAGVLRKIAEG